MPPAGPANSCAVPYGSAGAMVAGPGPSSLLVLPAKTTGECVWPAPPVWPRNMQVYGPGLTTNLSTTDGHRRSRAWVVRKLA